jgi:hypothetical protein
METESPHSTVVSKDASEDVSEPEAQFDVILKV